MCNMETRTGAFFTIYLLVVTLFTGGICQDIPTQEEFITDLLNVSISMVGFLANNFSFIEIPASQVKFVLYTANNEAVQVSPSNASLDLTKQTKFIIHGWTDNGYLDWIRQMASFYHEKGDYNTLAVDWSEPADKNYLYAASSVESVGYHVATFICDIIKDDKTLLQNIHVIGHSLGAHVSGFTGKHVYSICGDKLKRVTALDAANPLFEFPIPRPCTLKVCKGDADFVDFVHTNRGLEGELFAYGNVDFYVNDGGPIQPGCESNISSAISCSHQSSHMFYAVTIVNPQEFEGVKCNDDISFDSGVCYGNSKTYMGDKIDYNAEGTYYVNSSSVSVYENEGYYLY